MRPDLGLLARADRLIAADEKIDTTFRRRDSSPEAYCAWERAAKDGHLAREAMYPDSFRQSVRALADGDRSAVEPALVFLETDPWCSDPAT
jgi:hypothetical protein